MEQGFPPDSMTATHAVIMTHVFMLPLIATLGFALFKTMRDPPSKQLVRNWGRALVLLLSVGTWWLMGTRLEWRSAAQTLFQIYLCIVALIGAIGMQGCDFRVWRQTKTRFDAIVCSTKAGVARIAFVLMSAAAIFAMLASLIRLNRDTVSPVTRFFNCKDNLRQLGVAMQADIKANDGKWPRSTNGTVPVSWRVGLLQYMDRNALIDAYDHARPWDDKQNLPVAQTDNSALLCPSSRSGRDHQERHLTSYVMVTGPGTIAPGDRDIREADIRDGMANTAVFVEAVGLNVVWTEPRDADVSRTPIGVNLKGQGETDSPGLMSSYHSDGRAQMVFADGNVKTINERIDPQVLKSLTTIAGGERLPAKW